LYCCISPMAVSICSRAVVRSVRFCTPVCGRLGPT
jgi:hypothetical protein